MSGNCGNCDCADQTQSVNENSYGLVIVETERSYMDTVVMDAPEAEQSGKCNCGDSCPCVNCTCGC